MSINVRLSVTYIGQYDSELIYDFRIEDKVYGLFTINKSDTESLNKLFK